MAITVKHTKVSTVPDSTDTSLVRPSDWNADHTLSGLGTMAEQNANNVSITGGSISGTTVSGYIPTTEKGAALGVATLDAGGKVPTSQIPLQGDLNYQGTWNATTNSPTLTSSVGTQGYYYVVDVAGTTNLNGITDWQIGDWAIFNGSVWQKVDNTDAVTSVNGLVGTVVLTTTNIAEGTNEYYTDARARNALSAGTGISYANSTGVITNSLPDQVVSITGAGTSVVTGTYPNFTVTSNDQYTGDVVGPASATDNAIARFDTTTGKLIQNSVVTVSDTGAIAGATTITNLDYLDFDTTYNTTLGAGQLGWNGNDTLGLGMIGGNVVQHIGEDTFYYVKASATITKGQVIMFTGALGASGVILAAPSTGVTNPNYIMGIAAENIANNAFGLIQAFGVLRSVDTQGFSDGDVVYYNSAVTGGYTATYPTSGPIVIVGAVINGGSAGGGVLQIRVSVTQRMTASTGISVSQNGTGTTITNTGVTSATAGTGISVSGSTGAVTVTNTAPDQTVAITGAGGAVVTGTYPNFTITTPSGTVTSVTGTAPVVSSGGATPAISMDAANGTTNGYLTSTDWTTFNGKAPSVTYTSTYIPYGQGTTTPNQSSSLTFDGTVQNAPVQRASNGIIANSKTVSTSYTIASGDSAMSTGPVSVSSGQTVTISSGSRWVIL